MDVFKINVLGEISGASLVDFGVFKYSMCEKKKIRRLVWNRPTITLCPLTNVF